MTREQYARKHGVTMNTDSFLAASGLRKNVLYAVLRRDGFWYRLYGPGLHVDGYWVHASGLNFEGPPCMFKKEV